VNEEKYRVVLEWYLPVVMTMMFIFGFIIGVKVAT